MATSMKKVEVYAALDSCERVLEYLGSERLYWYRDTVELGGSVRVCRVVFYAPVHALVGILEGLAGVLDLRRRENVVTVLDVETGIGRPYRLAGRRFRQLARSVVSRPLQALVEESEEKSLLYPAQLILVVIAGLIALAGLAMDNPYIIIGAMLISPILGPIYSFAVALTIGRRRTALRSLGTLGSLLVAAFLASLAASLVAGALGRGVGPTGELLMRARPSLVDLLLALLLGSASIIAVSSNVTEALTGIAIAAAIVPPTATLGWALTYDARLALGALETVLYNVVGLLAGGTVTILAVIALRR